MKTNKFTQLVKYGLSVKSLMTLSESEINTLHKLYEGKDVCKKCGKKKCICEKKKVETKEQVSTSEKTIRQKETIARGDIAKKGIQTSPGTTVSELPTGGGIKIVTSDGESNEEVEIGES